MAVGQAVAVAFGLAFLILGGLYVIVRSEQAAQGESENPTAAQSKGWLLIHRGITVLFVGMALWVGTWLLIHSLPNIFFAAGMATWFYALALKRAFGLTAVLRTTFSAYVLAGVLCGIGSALHGGPIGIVGAILSLAWSAIWLWVLKAVWNA